MCRFSTPARAARPPPFVERGMGDVLVSWENEAFLAIKELGPGKFEIVAPSLSILAEPAIALRRQSGRQERHARGRRGLPEILVHAASARRSRRATSIARSTRRSRAKLRKQFPRLSLITIDEIFGGWQKAQRTHFADGGVFDQIYLKK